MKKRKATTSFSIDIDVEFLSYDDINKNKKAKAQIRRWLLSALKEQIYIPLYIDNDDNGALIEDCTQKIKYRLYKYDKD